VRFTSLDLAFSVEAPYPRQRPALSHTAAPELASPGRVALPPLAVPLPGALATTVARLEGIAGRFWRFDDDSAGMWMSTPAESGMPWNELVAAVTCLPRLELHVIVDGPGGAAPSRPPASAGAARSVGVAAVLGAPATAARITTPFHRGSPKTWLANLDVLGSSPNGREVGIRLSTCRPAGRFEASTVETRRDGLPLPEPTLPPVGSVTRSS